MVTALEVVAAAFVAQLLVLPGEKVQFIIAGLSTRYNPMTVVAAAGSAFAGWTVLEILFGEALVQLLPGLVLDVFTGGMFLLFAVLLVRSAPAAGQDLGGEAAAAADGDREVPVTNGGGDRGLDVSILGHRVPQPFGGFVPIFAMMAAGEFGDKTQLVTITLATRFGAHPGIWVGEMLAIIPVSIANAYFFHRFAHRVDLRKAHYVGAAVFLFFAIDTLLAAGAGISVWESTVRWLSETLLAAV